MIIRNATILCFQDLSQRKCVDLRIADGRIVEIGQGLDGPGSTSDSVRSAARDEELIDASGMYLIPGLVNLHAHTAMTLLRGAAEDVNEELRPLTPTRQLECGRT